LGSHNSNWEEYTYCEG